MPNPFVKELDKKTKGSAEKPIARGNTLFRVGLVFSLAASILIITEGIVLITRSPLPYPIQLIADWGGYLNLIFGIITLAGFLSIALMHKHKRMKTISAVAIGGLSILSFILFGGGFYLGFILGLFGSLLTASRD